MSDDGGSNSSSLREFRIHKKPQLSHSSSQDQVIDLTDSPRNTPPPSDTPPRRRIILISDSSSEDESDRTVIYSPEKLESDSTGAPAASATNHDKDSVAAKESQMKYLLASFPAVDAMVIHDVLSRYDFNADTAADELSRCHAISLQPGGYAKWKEAIDNEEKLKNEKKEQERRLQLQNHHHHTNHQKNHHQQPQRSHSQGSTSQNGFKRRTSDNDNDTGIYNNKKKKFKRRRSVDSDDSQGSNLDFKDRRVFDSDEDSDVELSSELTSDKKRVLEFFQTATANELQLMSYCSKKKADLIIQLRPFKDWIDLVEKLGENKSLSTDMLNAAQQVLSTRNNIRNLMKKCTNLAQQMERAVAAGAGVKEQPSNLSVVMRLTNYQMVGLNWLAVLHAQKVNGILADEMGLGKTVQVIAFLAYLKLTQQAISTHLVVVPASTLDNWRTEFTRWCPELRVFMYYGSMEERKQFRIDFSKGILADFDVVLTTYTLVGNTPEERKMFKVTKMHYVVFDEAHMLKNMNTQRYENLIRINAKHRLLLTGTPLQNNLLELMSLLIFVMPKMFAEKTEDIKSLFQKNSAKTKANDDSLPAFEREQIEQAKNIMKPFVLRRLKCDVLQDLPKKTDHVHYVPMVDTQKEQYENLVYSYKNAAEDPANAYTGMSIMTDLRKLSNHPLLMRFHFDHERVNDIAQLLANDPGYKETNVEYVRQDLYVMSDFEINTLCKYYRCVERFILPDSLILTSGKFVYLDQVLPELQQEGHRVLIFSQYVIMLNVLEAYLNIRHYSYLRLDGSTPVGERQDLIDEYTENSSLFIFLLSTRAGGLGINLTAADTVIIHDIDFNPYNDKQAEDRCHRMGQTRPVSVHRLVSQGSIEEGMMEMNKEKLKLEKQITMDAEADNPDVKSVVRLLSSALGIDNTKVTAFVSPQKT